MAWNDPSETVVGGTGQLYTAAVGTALPTDVDAALNASFVGLGLHSEDGVSVNRSQEIFRLGAWQSRNDVRRERESETFQLTAALLQWNEATVVAAFGGGSVTSTANGYKYTPPAVTEEIEEVAVVCEVEDGNEALLFVIPRANAVETVESSFARSQGSMLPVTFEALEPDDGSAAWYFLASSGAFATGS